MSERSREDPKGPFDLESELLDLGELSLAELRSLDDSALAHAIRRLVHEAEHPEDVSLSWNASL